MVVTAAPAPAADAADAGVDAASMPGADVACAVGWFHARVFALAYLFVPEAARRRGLATALLRRVATECAARGGCRVIEVDDMTNHDFYTRAGFVAIAPPFPERRATPRAVIRALSVIR